MFSKLRIKKIINNFLYRKKEKEIEISQILKFKVNLENRFFPLSIYVKYFF